MMEDRYTPAVEYTDAEVMEGRDPRDETDTWLQAVRATEEHFQAESDARDALEEAAQEQWLWEQDHESEYKELFSRGEHGELNRLDAEWNELEADVDAARELLQELEGDR